MKLTKKGKIDKRFRTAEALELSFWKKYGSFVVVAILGALAGTVLITSLMSPSKKLIDPRGTGEVKQAQVLAAEPLTWNDAIRQVFPADEAGRMIRICLAESGNKFAYHLNTNGSYDYGPCQINSCHKSTTMSNADWKTYLNDPKNNANEVRKIYLSSGWGAWVVARWIK